MDSIKEHIAQNTVFHNLMSFFRLNIQSELFFGLDKNAKLVSSISNIIQYPTMKSCDSV